MKILRLTLSWVALALLVLGILIVWKTHGFAVIGCSIGAMVVSGCVLFTIHLGSSDDDENPSTWRWFLYHRYNPVGWLDEVSTGGGVELAQSILLALIALVLVTIEIIPVVLLATFGKTGGS